MFDVAQEKRDKRTPASLGTSSRLYFVDPIITWNQVAFCHACLNESLTKNSDVFGSRARGALAFREFNSLAFAQIFELRTVHHGVMEEQVAFGATFNESETFVNH